MSDILDPAMIYKLRELTRPLANIDCQLIDEKRSLQGAIDGIESHSPKLDRLIYELRESCEMNGITNTIRDNERTLQTYRLL